MPAALRRDRARPRAGATFARSDEASPALAPDERRHPSSEIVSVAPASVRLTWTAAETEVLVVLLEVNGKAVDPSQRVVHNGGRVRAPNDVVVDAVALYWKIRLAAASEVLETLTVTVELRAPLVDAPVELRAHRLGLTGDTFVLEHPMPPR